MIQCLSLLVFFVTVHANHFNGGTITWKPVNVYDNSSSVTITIEQSYWWTYPTIQCATNIPISTSGRSSQGSNLTCVVDCTTDGGYSSKPISTLTDCTSTSSSLGMLTSQRSANITLTAGAHFYLAYVGNAWLGIGNPVVTGLQWSITTGIDLRMRPDGFINTPPVASIISPQYIFVNRTSQIHIPASDVNIGDDVRCRWAVYWPGFRRRRQADEYAYHQSSVVSSTTSLLDKEKVLVRRKRSDLCTAARCVKRCGLGCPCSCSRCLGTTCSGAMCMSSIYCPPGTTTVDTPGPLQSTSTYPARQAIDECGGICFPSTLPSNTTLSNCTLSIKSLIPNVWYAAAIQVEDFISSSSTIPMSSVPVQFLIYVMPEPVCSQAPIIMPFTGCLEITVGVPMNFNLTVVNQCNPSVVDIGEVVLSKEITGMQRSNLTTSSTNASLTNVGFTWTPQVSQIGEQQMCAAAYTEERLQSAIYCVTFSVISSPWVCVTTTTTSTSTSSTSSSTSTVTTSTTSTTSTTTTTASTTTATSTSTSTTPVATTVITSTAAPSETASSSGKGPSWGLIAGILSIALPLALCTCCCLYGLLWSPAAKRRRQEQEELTTWQYEHLSVKSESMMEASTKTSEALRIRKPSKSFQVYDLSSEERNVRSTGSMNENGSSILKTAFENQDTRPTNAMNLDDTKNSFEMQGIRTQPSTHRTTAPRINAREANPFVSTSTSDISVSDLTHRSLTIIRPTSNQDSVRTLLTSPSDTPRCIPLQLPGNAVCEAESPRSPIRTAFYCEKPALQYPIGAESKTKFSTL